MEDVGSCNGTKMILIPSEKMEKNYGQELDFERLESQLLMLPDLVKTETRRADSPFPLSMFRLFH